VISSVKRNSNININVALGESIFLSTGSTLTEVFKTAIKINVNFLSAAFTSAIFTRAVFAKARMTKARMTKARMTKLTSQKLCRQSPCVG
jgi:uncharacterized protein YjbI with pentapeptide repeats